MIAVPLHRLHVRVSLAQPVGSLAAVVGRPAEGTAVARVIAGLATPKSGRVWVAERDVTRLRPVDRQIGYVPAGAGLLPHLTVRENVEYGLRHREYVLNISSNWQHELIGQLELGSVLDRRPHELSPARRWRVALARAMVSLPEVLLIDLPEADTVAGTLPELLADAQSREAAGQLSTVVTTADERVTALAQHVAPVEVVR